MSSSVLYRGNLSYSCNSPPPSVLLSAFSSRELAVVLKCFPHNIFPAIWAPRRTFSMYNGPPVCSLQFPSYFKCLSKSSVSLFPLPKKSALLTTLLTKMTDSVFPSHKTLKTLFRTGKTTSTLPFLFSYNLLPFSIGNVDESKLLSTASERSVASVAIIFAAKSAASLNVFFDIVMHRIDLEIVRL